MQDLTFLRIKHLIIHELPREGHPDGTKSDAVCPLPDKVRRFFEERMRESLGSKGQPVVFVDDHASPVRKNVTHLLMAKRFTGKDFVTNTQEVAKHLFDVHRTGVHSEGLLCVAMCSSKAANAIAIIKLELEEGVRAQLKGPQGKQHFEIEVLDDLMLTQRTRVFKAALFEQSASGDTDALASDNQAHGGKIAKFFLDNFLGCELAAKPDLSTKAFFETSEQFFKSVDDPVLRSSYQTALIAELCSNATTVRTADFADGHLQARDRAAFAKSLLDAGVPHSFPKDTTRIKNRTHRIQYDFDGSVTVTMPPEALNKTVMLTHLDSGKTRVDLELRLVDTKGTR